MSRPSIRLISGMKGVPAGSQGVRLSAPGQGPRRDTKDGQAVANMDYESGLISGGPCDQPGCAASANP